MKKFRIIEVKKWFSDEKVYYPKYKFYFLWVLPFWCYYIRWYGRLKFDVFEEAETFIEEKKRNINRITYEY